MVLLRWSCLTLSRHEGTPSQQRDGPKPLRHASRTLADGGHSSGEDGEKKGVPPARCTMKIWEAKRYKPQVTQSGLGEATSPHGNCYMQLLITLIRSDCQTQWQRWQMPLLGIRENRNKTSEGSRAGHWRKAQSSSHKVRAGTQVYHILGVCVQTHVAPARLPAWEFYCLVWKVQVEKSGQY